MQPGASAGTTILADLKREGSLMACLRHPCIVQLLGICMVPPALITELCPRGSVAEVLKVARKAEAEGRVSELTWRRKLGMALDAARGMVYLHAHSPPVLHRDLKVQRWRPRVVGGEHALVDV